MSERTLAVNTPAALAAMMRQAQSDPEFREQLVKRGIPFGSLATALASLADVVAERNECRKALRDLVRAYVSLMGTGRDRIVQLGGQCDPLEVMERGDPYLRQAREAIAPAAK